MQKHKTIYSEEYIQYRPYWTSGWFMISCLFFVSMVFVVILLSKRCCIELKVVAAVPAIIFGTFFRKEMRSAFDIITVSRSGVRFYNEFTKKEQIVLWDNVAAVYFWTNHYKFPNYFFIFLNKPGNIIIDYNKHWDYALPDLNVDGKKLQSFIPSYLRVNESIYDWDK